MNYRLHMKTAASSKHSLLYSILLPLAVLVTAVTLQAQAGAGSITGRVFNTGAKEYVRNAEVRIEGTNIATYTSDGGLYRLPNVTAGEVRVSVRYAGTETAFATLAVAPGQTTAHDFELREISYGKSDSGVVLLDKLEVAGTRVGQAKALMESRAALNAKNVVAADNYGELTMGDVGEFMKSMPGLSLDYVEVDTSAVRIGGLDPKYSNFTTDDVRMATATSNNNAGRQNSFEQMSITGIDSIEFNNTLNAKMDADSPGGTINLRSKYAFQRNGRTIIFQLYAVGTSDSTLEREYFPDDKKYYRIFPSGQFGYADIFFKGRLGIEFNASYNANFVQQDRVQMRYNYTGSGATVSNPKLNDILFRPGPKMTSRGAGNLSVDFKITPELVFSWRSTYSLYEVEYVNQYTYLYAPVTTQPAGSTTTNLIANPVIVSTGAAATAGNSPRLRTEYSHRYAGTPAYVLAPKLEYKGNSWDATARASYSRSEFNFRDNSEGFFVRTDDWITRLGFTATRPSEDSPTWTLTQTAGRPWGDPTSWNRDDDIGNNIRTSESDAINEMRSAYVDLKKQLSPGGLPVTLLAGFGTRGNNWRTTEGSYSQFQYVGPTNDLTQMAPEAVIPWTQNYKFDLNLDGKGGNMTAQNWRADSNYAVYDIYKEHPTYFVPDTLGNVKRELDNNKRISEQINATYLEAQTRIGRARFDLGFRYEKTETKANVADIRPLSEVAAAGYPVSATAATTVPGLLYQYHDGQQTTRKGTYDDWFLSGGVKYDFFKNLVGQAAFSQAILRPDYANLGGVTSVNENTMTVTVPNSKLKPEHSAKFYAGLQYYIEPSGLIGISYYKLKLKDMQQAGYTVNPEDVGYDPSDYPGYTYVSTQNNPNTLDTDGFTIEYSQQLTFLPGALKGIALYGSFTRVIAEGVRIGMPDKMANWGVRYRYGRIGVHINGTWQAKSRLGAVTDTQTTSNTGIRWLDERQIWGVSISYKLTKHLDLMFSGRNILNAPTKQYSNVSSRLYLYDVYGSMWNVGIRGTF